MWRTLLVNPVLVAASVAVGVTACRLGGANPHGHEAALAAAVAVAASLLAGGVLVLGRLQPPTPAGPTVSALLAMVAHLAGVGLLSIAVLTTPGLATAAFAFWVLGLFWVTLLGLAGVCVWTVRAAGRAAGR